MNTQKAVTKRYDILTGPSKDLLFDAVKYAYSKNANIEVKFEIATVCPVPVENDSRAETIPMKVERFRVTSITHEDGSGESFIISGYCMVETCPVVYKQHKFKAYYNTKRRKGWIAFEAQ